jgi:hypothetical protein
MNGRNDLVEIMETYNLETMEEAEEKYIDLQIYRELLEKEEE